MKPIDEVPLGIMIDKGVKSIGKSIKKEDPEEKRENLNKDKIVLIWFFLILLVF